MLFSTWVYQIIGFIKLFFNGSLGVNVFFVISGFLITTLLLKENAEKGTISLTNFYLRRILRIWPAAYLYLFVVILINFYLKLHISHLYIAATALFMVNFQFLDKYKSPLISHYWSLSVEEQFYFIFPFIIKNNFKAFLLFISFIVFILPVIISIQFLYLPINSGILFAITHYFIKFQAISVGCLFSIICLKGIITKELFGKLNPLIMKILITIAIFALYHTDAVSPSSIYINLVISLFVALLLVLNLFFTDDYFYKFLNLKLVAKIGVLSYSIYIWHLLILNNKVFPTYISAFPQNIVVILAVAVMSYYLWEKKFLNLKKRFITTSANK